MLSIAMLLIPIVFVATSGFCSARYGLFDEKSVSVFTRFTFYVAMPCQLFKDFSILDLSQTINLNYMTAYGSAIAIMATTTFFISRFLIRDSVADSAINVMGTSQVNTAYFAIPLFILVFDNAAPVFPIIIIQVTALTMAILLLIENDQTHKSRNASDGTKSAWYKIAMILAKNPIILASISGSSLDPEEHSLIRN